MVKLICIADFSSHYFKEISSLSTSIEEQLNKDSRLDVNAPEEQHPDLKCVLQENRDPGLRLINIRMKGRTHSSQNKG